MVITDHRAARNFRHDPATTADILHDADVAVVPVGPVNTDLAEHLARHDRTHRTHQTTVACDVHAIPALTGPHEPFCAAADILFMSDERLPSPAEQWLGQVMDAGRSNSPSSAEANTAPPSPPAAAANCTTCPRPRPAKSRVPSGPATPCAPASSTATHAACHPNEHCNAQPCSPLPNSPPSVAQLDSSPPTNSTRGSPQPNPAHTRHDTQTLDLARAGVDAVVCPTS